MVGLKPFVLLGFLHVQPGINASRAHGVLPEEKSDGDGADANRRQKISPPNPGDQQKDRADRAQQQRRSYIRLRNTRPSTRPMIIPGRSIPRKSVGMDR